MPVVPRPADIANYNAWAAAHGQPLGGKTFLQRPSRLPRRLQGLAADGSEDGREGRLHLNPMVRWQ